MASLYREREPFNAPSTANTHTVASTNSAKASSTSACCPSSSALYTVYDDDAHVSVSASTSSSSSTHRGTAILQYSISMISLHRNCSGNRRRQRTRHERDLRAERARRSLPRISNKRATNTVTTKSAPPYPGPKDSLNNVCIGWSHGVARFHLFSSTGLTVPGQLHMIITRCVQATIGIPESSYCKSDQW
jgi:hypothetical protein